MSPRTLALRYFVQAVRAARGYDALAIKSWRGADDGPEPHVLVRFISVGTVGLSSASMAKAWWQAAWQFAEIRWLAEEMGSGDA